MRKSTGLGLLLAALLLSSSHKVQAMSLYAGLLGGYGFTPEKHEVEPYGFGLGAAAGITLPAIPIYVGARLLWFVGATGPGHTSAPTTSTTATGMASVSVKLSESYLTYGIDLGYDLELGPLVLRPGLGIGSGRLNANSVGTGGVKTKFDDSSLYLSPALALLFKPGLLFVGAEARYIGMTEKAHLSGIALLAHLGVTL
jgi:hypothetical protein